MSDNSKYSAVAETYARALVELAAAGDQAEPIAEQLAEIRQVILDNPTFGLFLRDPSIGHAERAGVIEQAFKGRVLPLVWAFLSIANEKGRLSYLPQIAVAYRKHLDRMLGKVDVDVTVARSMDEAMFSEIRDRIGQALDKKATVNQTVDDSIIGGMVVRVGDKLFDGSVRAQLESMKQDLLSAAHQTRATVITEK